MLSMKKLMRSVTMRVLIGMLKKLMRQVMAVSLRLLAFQMVVQRWWLSVVTALTQVALQVVLKR